MAQETIQGGGSHASASRRRVGRPKLQPRTLEDMRAPQGKPVRMTELRAMTGFSRTKLEGDVEEGYLTAPLVRCRTRTMYLIAYPEAQRYLRALKLIP